MIATQDFDPVRAQIPPRGVEDPDRFTVRQAQLAVAVCLEIGQHTSLGPAHSVLACLIGLPVITRACAASCRGLLAVLVGLVPRRILLAFIVGQRIHRQDGQRDLFEVPRQVSDLSTLKLFLAQRALKLVRSIQKAMVQPEMGRPCSLVWERGHAESAG
jgi:hypothetical protein